MKVIVGSVGLGLAPVRRQISLSIQMEHPSDFTPIQVCGTVVHGFGRGSKELGIPTANMDAETVSSVAQKLNSRYGIYYGWAWFPEDTEVSKADIRYPMVMSFGLNPHYNNSTPSVEPHLIHSFDGDFYDAQLCLSIEGYIRNEMKMNSLDELIETIHRDIRYALDHLAPISH